MPFEDILWSQGKDNMGGLVGDVYFCPTEDIIGPQSMLEYDKDGETVQEIVKPGKYMVQELDQKDPEKWTVAQLELWMEQNEVEFSSGDKKDDLLAKIEESKKFEE